MMVDELLAARLLHTSRLPAFCRGKRVQNLHIDDAAAISAAQASIHHPVAIDQQWRHVLTVHDWPRAAALAQHCSHRCHHPIIETIARGDVVDLILPDLTVTVVDGPLHLFLLSLLRLDEHHTIR
jgi:hypothetical protein